MILESFDGCTSSSMTIDGVCTTKYTESELKAILCDIINKMDRDTVDETIICITESFGTSSSYICETCGDSSYTTTFEIK